MAEIDWKSCEQGPQKKLIDAESSNSHETYNTGLHIHVSSISPQPNCDQDALLKRILTSSCLCHCRDKEVVTAAMVVSPDRPGRVVAILGSCSDASHVADVARGADLLIYSCGFPATSQAAVAATAAAKAAAAATTASHTYDASTTDDAGVARSALWNEGVAGVGSSRTVVESSSEHVADDVDVSAAVAGAQLAVATGAKRLMLTKFDGRWVGQDDSPG